MTSPKITVIIPVYKAEKYLDRCLESIVNQTYKNLEIILVDDGSPDNCPAICDEYAQKDSRIKVIHKENGGAAMARNAGLDIAKGEYIGFVDSDDYICPDMFEKLLNSMIKNNSDIAICGSKEIDFSGKTDNECYINFEYEVVSPRDCLKQLCDRGYIHNVIWNKLYKSKCWEGIRFPDIHMFEDEAVLPYVYMKARSISIVQELLYYYVQTEGSIMHRNFEEKTFQTYAKIFENRMKFFKEEKDDELYGLSVFGFAGKIKADYIGLTYSDEDTIKMRKMLVKKYREIFKEVKKSRALSGNIKKYLEYRLFDISPLFYTKVILKLI